MTETQTTLRYQSSLLIGGQWFPCLESYQSIFERMRDASMKIAAEADTDGGSLTFMPPLELTVRMSFREDGSARPTPIAVQIGAIAAFIPLPEDQQGEVE